MTKEDIRNKSKAEKEYLAGNSNTPLWILDALKKDGEYYVRDAVRNNLKWEYLRFLIFDIDNKIGGPNCTKYYSKLLAISKYLEII
jgi:hypothetical protein